MLLSIADIERLERKGYNKEFFARFDGKGYARLLNWQEFCVFYDFEKGRCRIYADRPLGCRLYPVIYDEAKGIVVDEICCAHSTVTERQIVKRGKKVLKLLEKIDAEAERRRSS